MTHPTVLHEPLLLCEAVAVLVYEKELTFSTYAMLSEWLGCYRYILPADRVVSPEVYALPIKPIPFSVLNLYYFIQILSTSYNLSEQNRIIGYIKCLTHDSKISLTLA